MPVSFIVPLFNCLSLTQAMLASLRATLPAGLEHEIVFIDDGSTDGTRQWLATLPAPCRFILNEKNLGFAGACNRGAAATTGELLFFLNNDLELLPGWFEPMQTLLSRATHPGLVGNIQLNAASGLVDHTGISFNHKGKPRHDTSVPVLPRLMGEREVAALTGACFGIRRVLWRELGGFDEGFINGAEDVDLCLRARVMGFKHFIAVRSVVRHHISASTGRKVRDEQNTFRLVRRWSDTIVRLAAHDWCRYFIVTHWDQSFVYDDALGRSALFHWLGLAPQPPEEVVAGTRCAVELELKRWETMFPDGS
jgi:O-antigen biosynthesis protein